MSYVSGDRWSDAEAYDAFVGRWSRGVALAFVDWLDADPGGAWLDVGCGTGALTQAVVSQTAPGSVTAVDPSAAFVEGARARVTDERATFLVGDAASLPVPDGAYDRVVSGLVLNFVPDVAEALAEMRRVTAPGGTVAAYVWDYAGGMQILRFFWDAAVALDPAAATRAEGVRFPLCRPDALEEAFSGAGLGAVEVRPLDVPTVLTGFDDYWAPFLGGQGPACGYVASLTDAGREQLRRQLHETLPVASDGSLPLTARAWAVRGRVIMQA